MRPPLVVWQFTDGKPGHESQARGLIAALKRRVEVHSYRLAVSDCRCGITSLLRRRHPCQSDYPPPDLILACGRTTHFAALAARRACGGRLVSLMKPPLPMRLYDLCLIPEHDGVRAGGNVLLTRGALNPVVSAPASADRDGCGLFLIGGPSAHHRWPRTSLSEQVVQIAQRDPKRHWTLTTSRRTPSEFAGQLRSQVAAHSLDARVHVIPAEETPQGWVAEQLSRSDVAVVTEDSVSMVYESLTAGVSVSLIRMPRRGRSRVAAGVARLLHDGLVSSIDDYLTSGSFPAAEHTLAEADRCADMLLAQWFSRRLRAA